MDIYIVDANLIFSSILNLNSGISRFIQNKKDYNVNFYAPEILKVEILNHHSDIIKASKLSEEEIVYAKNHIYEFITFIDDDIIPFDQYIKAMRIVRDVDPDDVNFVALNNYMDKTLWTGDIKLYNGLKNKGYNNVVIFKDLKKKYNID